MNRKHVVFLLFIPLLFASCDLTSSDDDTKIETPSSYEFTRNGESTVSFSGQTTRIMMAEELSSSMMDFDNATEEQLLRMFRNQTADGGDANPYSSAELNAATKNIKSKVAASADYFSSNTTASAAIKAQFENWISSQVEEVFPNENTLAEPGVAGQIADGSSTRYVNAKGFEYNQLVGKSLIGALMTDQMLNNYLSTAVLDAGTNREDNTNGVTVEGKAYTNMEHKWDEAYGYLYGTAADPANPNATIGADDGFLNKYLGRLNNNPNFEGVAQEVFDAFALGRAAIVAGDYELRDEQTEIIRDKVSTIIGVRSVYYLESGASALEGDNPDYGAAFHDLSEAYGFIYSLQFTRMPGTNEPYFSRAEVQSYLNELEAGNGLWDVSPETLTSMSAEIASRFIFTVAQTN